MDQYFLITRKIHEIMGQYAYDALSAIDGVAATRPEATFYLLADFNHFAPDFERARIRTAQKLSESLIVHPYHTAIVGGDSLVLERTDYSARIAFVDYDGAGAYRNYVKNTPKTRSERTAFVAENAPRLANGIRAVCRFIHDLQPGRSRAEMLLIQ